METSRYHRQVLLPQIGPEGQERLSRSRVLLVGCGALGSVVAEQLVRAGVGMLRIVDRDIVELTNLQRQVLFDEQDAKEDTPKAIAAAARLERINSTVRIEPFVADLHAGNVEKLAGLEGGGAPVDLIVDGTDNVQTRFLLNDVSVKHRIPWIYGACVGTEGRCMAIRPPQTACLRCLFPAPPQAGELPTCDTAGILAAASSVVASLQVVAAVKWLARGEMGRGLVVVDIWQPRVRVICPDQVKREDCPTCGRRKFEFLEGALADGSISLCGRNAVQVRPLGGSSTIDLGGLADRLANVGTIERTPYLLRCDLREPRGMTLTVFSDGRAIVGGTTEPHRAKSIYARFVGT